MVISIDWWIAELKRLGAKDVDQYERKLRSFRSNERKIFEFIAEARAAKLFLTNGVGVTMQDRPDLRLDFNGEIIYAEVKHQHEKEIDRRDEARMAAAGPYEFVQIGNVFDDEQQHGWQGMCATAIKKESQYVEGFPNILVFVNHSNSIDLHLRSAVNEFNDAVQKGGAGSPLRKLGGMMMIGINQSVGYNPNNVEFGYTSYALKTINPYFVELMNQGQIA
jgi:hypothetical protein